MVLLFLFGGCERALPMPEAGIPELALGGSAGIASAGSASQAEAGHGGVPIVGGGGSGGWYAGGSSASGSNTAGGEAGGAGAESNGSGLGGLGHSGSGDGGDSGEGANAGSGGDMSEGGQSNSAWSPADLPGTVLWLDASRGLELSGSASNQLVEVWQDRSGFGNHALRESLGTAPRFAQAIVNGRPGVQFNGQRDGLRIEDSAALNFGTEDFSIHIVAAWTSTSTSIPSYYGVAALLVKQEEVPPYRGPALWANDRYMFQVENAEQAVFTEQVGLNDGQFRLYGGRRVTASPDEGCVLELRVNGLPLRREFTEPAIALHSPGVPFQLGGRHGSTFQTLTGTVAEVVVVRGPLPEIELLRLERYLRENYRLW